MATTLINNLSNLNLESKLSQHLSRLEKLGGELNFSSYIDKVNEQNKNQPFYKKWEPSLSSEPLTPTNQDRINILNSNFKYVGIKKEIEGSKKYYEFIDTSNRENSYYANFKFLYFEVNSVNETYLASKFPYYYRWDVNEFQITKEIPKKLYLIERSADSFNSFYSYTIPDSTHSFLPGFYFSGRVVVLNNGTPLYEYFDESGYWGIKDALYMSPLRPDIDFPLGQPGKGMLEKLDCWLDYVGYFPSTGTLNNLGRFTGYSSTDLYNSKQTFYLYERKDGSVFLTRSLPNSEAGALAEHTSLIDLENNEFKFNLIPEFGESFLGINISSEEILTFIWNEA